MSFDIVSIQAQKNELPSLLNEFPKEQVILNSNSEVILSGQMLGYNTVCYTQGGQGCISNIVYVELVSSSKTIVFKHKIRIENGRAYGDFFLPTTLKTGHYKLIAYTHWTLNNSEQAFDQKDIYIINPYLNATENNLKSGFKEDEKYIEIEKNELLNFKTESQSNGLEIKTDSNTYKERSKVELELKNTLNDYNFGYYNINVKKVDSINIVSHKTSIGSRANTTKSHYLPEMRGELIHGSVFNSKTNMPAVNQPVSLSIPGEYAVYKSTLTNGKGEFYFNVFENIQQEKALVQVVSETRNDFKINLDVKGIVRYDELQFYPLKLNTNLKQFITVNSIYNQVESAYYNIKKDSVVSISPAKSFYGKPDITYVLDDFKRFNSVKTTFVEVVEKAAIRTTKGNDQFFVYDFDDPFGAIYQNVKPLLLMDGIQIQNENIVTEFNPNEIESVSLVKGIYSLGSVIYNGIIDIKLKTQGILNIKDTFAEYLDIRRPIVQKDYYKQVYNDEDNRIPDFRTHLLWQPNFEINSSSNSIEFYTSDVPGYYLIELKGITKEGRPIYLNKLIEVTKE